jgi:hypothetical protein
MERRSAVGVRSTDSLMPEARSIYPGRVRLALGRSGASGERGPATRLAVRVRLVPRVSDVIAAVPVKNSGVREVQPWASLPFACRRPDALPATGDARLEVPAIRFGSDR